MKIIFLITIVILIQANNHDLRAQLSRIDRYGKVEINLKEQENREIKDTITLQNQVTLEVGSKTVLTYKTKPKKKLFHPPLKKNDPDFTVRYAGTPCLRYAQNAHGHRPESLVRTGLQHR